MPITPPRPLHRHRHRVRAVALALATLATPASAADSTTPDRAVTFNKDVAPILFKNCTTCHRPGEVAPFPLLTYRDAAKRAELLKTVTAEHEMPPWKPQPGHGEFSNGRRLSPEEIDLIARWADGGAVEGRAADLPPAPVFPTGWQLGTPDILVTLPAPVDIPTTGRDVYLNVVVPLKVPAGKYIKAIEFRPGNRRVVHHGLLYYDTTGRARKRDEADPAPGFRAVTPPGKIMPGTLSIWTPGRNAIPLPDGLSMAWPEGADLVVQLHLHPSGKPEVEQTTVGVFLTDEPPSRVVTDLIMLDTKINMPPGEKAYRTRATRVLPDDMEALAVFPHMHLIGKEIKLTATLPDGTERPLIWINDWDFNWQDLYVFAKPVPLPKGTKLVLEAVHDNSADNPRNPTKPPGRVRWGEQTTDEMTVAFVSLVPAHKGESGPKDLSKPSAAASDFGSPEFRANAALRMLDENDDGGLSLDELLAAPGKRRPRADVEKWFDRFDQNHDKRLSPSELSQALGMLGGGR